MLRVFGWLIVLAVLYFGYQAGWFNFIVDYFSDSAKQARQERIIEHEDGSYTEVKYRNVFDVVFSGKN